MKDRRRSVQALPPVRAAAELRAETADAKARTVEVTFYSGAAVLRGGLFSDPYELEFEMSAKAADFGRLNAGAAVIDNHDTHGGVGAVLGRVEKAWLENGMAHAVLRFSKRAEVEPVWQDVQDGILRHVSMGTFLLEVEEVTAKGAPMRRLRATSWEPYEISIVPVPADAGAVIHAAAQVESRPCAVLSYAAPSAEPEDTMQVRLLATNETVEIEPQDFDEKLHAKIESGPAPKAAATSSSDSQRAVDEAIARDEEHARQIRRVADHFGLDNLWAQRQINLGTSVEQSIRLAADERAKRSPKTPHDIGFGDDREAAWWRRERMEEALVARTLRTEPPEPARGFMKYTFSDCALECLTWKGHGRGLHPRHDRQEIIRQALALHTTSDFPLLLGNVMNKLLLSRYENAMPTYRQIAARRTFSDFRAHNFLRVGDFPVPLKVNEHGEYKYGTMSENREQVTAATYGRIIGFSRQSLVNDDLGALGELAMAAAMRVVDFENSLFFTTCITAAAGLGPNLSDAVAVYNAAHGNVTGAGALSVSTLSEARSLMKKQTSLDGLKLNIPAEILLVSPDSETLAEQLTAPLSQLIGDSTTAGTTNVNPFAGRLRPIADANLSGTRFYVLASPQRVANYIYGYLNDAEGPRTEVRQGFEVDGVEFKLSLDFGVGAIDYRGGVTGAGA